MPSLAQRLSAQYQQQFGRAADANDPRYAAWTQSALPQMIQSDRDAHERSKRRWNTFGKIATGAALAPYAALVAPLLGGGAAAATGSSGIPGFVPGWEGSASLLFSGGGAAGRVAGLLRHPLTNLGAQGVFGMLGQRSQNKANDRAMQAQMSLTDRQLALEQQRLADERTDMLAARSEDQRRWEADEAYRRSVLEADNEERAYNRAISDRREATRAAFAPYQQMAMRRLGRYLR